MTTTCTATQIALTFKEILQIQCRGHDEFYIITRKKTINPCAPVGSSVRYKGILIAHAQDLNFIDGGISSVNSEVEFL